MKVNATHAAHVVGLPGDSVSSKPMKQLRAGHHTSEMMHPHYAASTGCSAAPLLCHSLPLLLCAIQSGCDDAAHFRYGHLEGSETCRGVPQ